jgi:DNA-binding transcriptional MocR family regulator
MRRVGVTEKQAAALAFIEDEIAAGRASPNTVELAHAVGCCLGEIARIISALEDFGYITRIPGRKRNIRLCHPAVKQASDEALSAELTARGYLVRKAPIHPVSRPTKNDPLPRAAHSRQSSTVRARKVPKAKV